MAGPMTDQLNQFFTSGAGTRSDYHLYAAGRTGASNGLVIQLHGDGAGEFATPNGGTLAAYNEVAKLHNMIMLAPRTPDIVGSRTWWENTSSPVWLLALLDYVRSQYTIDETKIWFMGYSGGAEVQTYFLLSDYSNRIGSGGNIMLGGGGASGLIMGRQPTAAFKATQYLHWAVGALDTDDGTGWNALAAAQGGFNRYGTEGFARRTFEQIPGEGHLASEDDGPRILAEQLGKVYPTAARNIFPSAPAGWESADGPINLGTQFSPTIQTKIVAGRYFKNSDANNGRVINMRLYGSGTAVAALGSRTQLASDPIGWVTVPFSAPATVVPGTTYTVAWNTTGTNYFVTDSYPLTATTSSPFKLAANHAVYLYGATGKPTAAGGYSYAIDVVTEGTVAAPPAGPAAVKALDSDQDGITQEWFNARAAEGVKLFVTAGTPWSVAGTETVNTPRLEIREQFRMALAAGMKIALYTRDPDHFNTGLDAAGPYLPALQFFAVDVEPDPGKPVTQAHIDGVLARGVRPIVYAGSGFWASVQGSNTTAFSQYPLWDTDARDTFSYTNWQANGADLVSPPPVAYGGWNGPNYSNLRIGVQQLFDYMLDGVKVDLNSFNASFLVEKDPVVVPVEPEGPVGWWTPEEVEDAKQRGKNLFLNGDMEQGQASWPANAAVTFVAAAKRVGTLGMRVKAVSAIVYLLQSVTYPTVTGKKYYAEMYVRRTGTETATYGGLGFVLQTNDGAGGYNTPTFPGGLVEGQEGQSTSGQIPTDQFVKVAAVLTVDQVGAKQVGFAPWIYTTPNTYDIDDVFVAAMSDRAAVAAKIRVFSAKVTATPAKYLRAYSARLTAVPQAASRLRIFSLRTIARVTPYAIRKSGKWAQIETKIQRSGKWE